MTEIKTRIEDGGLRMARSGAARVPRHPPSAILHPRLSQPHFARYFARSGWAHLLLLTGALLFLFPFVWMILTSFKTDEEIAEGGWWPAVPAYRASSPYPRRAIEVHKPANVSEDAWDAWLP